MANEPAELPLAASAIDSSYLKRSAKTLEEEKDALEDRMNKLARRLDETLGHGPHGGPPMLLQLINVVDDPDHLKIMAKVLNVAADVHREHQEVSSRLEVINYARSNPGWFAKEFTTHIDARLDDASNDIITGAYELLKNS